MPQPKTLDKLNQSERMVLTAMLNGGRWTNVSLGRACALNVNTAEKWYSFLVKYSEAGTIPYRFAGEFPVGGKLKEHWIVGKESTGSKSKPRSCECGVSLFFSTRNRNGTWACSECGKTMVR